MQTVKMWIYQQRTAVKDSEFKLLLPRNNLHSNLNYVPLRLKQTYFRRMRKINAAKVMQYFTSMQIILFPSIVETLIADVTMFPRNIDSWCYHVPSYKFGLSPFLWHDCNDVIDDVVRELKFYWRGSYLQDVQCVTSSLRVRWRNFRSPEQTPPRLSS
jgi:hypothetical protein